MNPLTRCLAGALAATCLLATSFLGAASAPDRALIVVGPSHHGPGTHEVAAGARLIAWCLQNLENAPPIPADVVHAWPDSPAKLEAYSTVVFIGDGFPAERLPDSDRVMKQLGAMMARGCGIVAIHFGVGLFAENVAPNGDHPLLHWMGGYFATKCDHHQSIARVYPDARIEPGDPNHPLSRGWEPFTLHDEPYINNYFGPDGNKLLPGAFAAAVSMLPPDNPRREIVAWGIQRPDTGRGFGVTLPHFFRNWRLEPLRRFILNGVVWTAGRDVPADGVRTTLPALETFQPESVEPRPRERK